MTLARKVASTEASRSTSRWRALWRWVPLVALCLLGSARWLISERWPASATTLASTSGGCGVAALLLFAAGWIPGLRGLGQGSASAAAGRSALAGALFVGGPVLALVLLPHELDGGTHMISLALTPVVAGVACAALGEDVESVAGLIWPGLVALAGMLLVLPQPTLVDPTADVVMVLGPLMTGVGAALLASRSSAATAHAGTGARPVAVMALSAAAVFLGAAALARGGVAGFHAGLSPSAALLDGSLGCLAVLAVLQLGAMRYTAVFALVPLLVLVEGIVLLRPPLTTRTELGLALLLLAGIVLLVRNGEQEPEAEGLELS